MTVKEAVSVLKNAETIELGCDGKAIKFDKDNFLMLDAYGNYIVDSIQAVGEDTYYEVNLAMRPVKAG